MSDFDGGATRAPGLELRGESLGLTRVGYTWQWRCFYVVTLLKALFRMLGLILQGENLDCSLGWLDPVTVALECRSLPEGVAVEEPRCPCGVKRLLVRIWSWL